MDLWSLLKQGVERDRNAQACPDLNGDQDGIACTYGQLLQRIEALANELGALGVEPGDRVAVLAGNRLAFLELYFACAGLGAILVPLGTRLAAPELHALLLHCTPKWLLADELFQTLGKSLQLPEGIQGAQLLDNPGPQSALRLKPWNGQHPAGKTFAPFHPHPCKPEDVAHIYYTSGTTGDPKGVMLTHGNVVQHALWAIEEFDLQAGDTWGHFAPMFHLADAWATFAITAVGGRHVFLDRFEARAALDLLIDQRVSITNLVPVMLQRMLDLPDPASEQLRALRLVLSGGAPIAPAVVQRILDFFHTEYAQTYGLTETSPYLTLSLPGPGEAQRPARERLPAVCRTGRPFGEVRLRVVDDAGNDLPKDDRSVGEIWANSPTVTPGYWQNPSATQDAFSGHWFCTGDLATWDASGSLNIVDRKKDMILTGGENVYSTEVEACLLAHPDVLEAAVYGVPSERWGEEVRAAIVWKSQSNPNLDGLQEFLRSKLAGFKLPKHFQVLTELPRTSSGKIRKRDLRASTSIIRATPTRDPKS